MDETMYEHSGQCPWNRNQSDELEQLPEDWDRDGEPPEDWDQDDDEEDDGPNWRELREMREAAWELADWRSAHWND